jgi:hypothetical protein
MVPLIILEQAERNKSIVKLIARWKLSQETFEKARLLVLKNPKLKSGRL